MRATLEQLKAMSDAELRECWQSCEFPFDKLTDCRLCLTEHTYKYQECEHKNLSQEVTAIFGRDFYPTENIRVFREHLDELYALRLFFSPYYKETTDAVQETVQEEKVSV
jgi:hypothetical protein